jgi:hypothetical protein
MPEIVDGQSRYGGPNNGAGTLMNQGMWKGRSRKLADITVIGDQQNDLISCGGHKVFFAVSSHQSLGEKEQRKRQSSFMEVLGDSLSGERFAGPS